MIVGNVRVDQLDGALTWCAGLAIDADGAPSAYHGTPGAGLDNLGNAGYPGRWWGLVVDAAGEPIIQGPTDPAPGYYVSPTALVDRQRPARDPHRYVDSSAIPYISVPPDLLDAGVCRGDVAWCLNRRLGRNSAAIVADVGPRGRLGEGSIALAFALGLDPSPRRGGAARDIACVVWPCSLAAPAWPRTIEDITADAAARLARWGGVARLAGARAA